MHVIKYSLVKINFPNIFYIPNYNRNNSHSVYISH